MAGVPGPPCPTLLWTGRTQPAGSTSSPWSTLRVPGDLRRTRLALRRPTTLAIGGGWTAALGRHVRRMMGWSRVVVRQSPGAADVGAGTVAEVKRGAEGARPRGRLGLDNDVRFRAAGTPGIETGPSGAAYYWPTRVSQSVLGHTLRSISFLHRHHSGVVRRTGLPDSSWHVSGTLRKENISKLNAMVGPGGGPRRGGDQSIPRITPKRRSDHLVHRD